MFFFFNRDDNTGSEMKGHDTNIIIWWTWNIQNMRFIPDNPVTNTWSGTTSPAAPNWSSTPTMSPPRCSSKVSASPASFIGSSSAARLVLVAWPPYESAAIEVVVKLSFTLNQRKSLFGHIFLCFVTLTPKKVKRTDEKLWRWNLRPLGSLLKKSLISS